MNVLGVVAILVAAQGAVQSDGALSATQIANSTKYDLTFDGAHVAGCKVTATSGSPQVDRYICDAARSCGDRYSDAEHRATCVARRREQLATEIATKLDQK